MLPDLGHVGLCIPEGNYLYILTFSLSDSIAYDVYLLYLLMFNSFLVLSMFVLGGVWFSGWVF